MRQPGFWFLAHQEPISRLLQPLGALYAAAVRFRLQAGQRERMDFPVISIGNLNVGGGGKTPAALALGARLIERGQCPHFISRGYGGKARCPTRVNPAYHNSAEVGDEPLILAACAPTWVGSNRAASAYAAARQGATSVILDDGHQNPDLAHDLSIVAVDARRGFGNGQVIPAGPLRETVDLGLARADILLLTGTEAERSRFLERWNGHLRVPVVAAYLQPINMGIEWTGERVVAFAGIADPERFFRTLATLGAELVKTVPLADHACPSERLLHRIAKIAKAERATLVTTEKDSVRLSAVWRRQILSLPVRLQIESWDEIDSRLSDIFNTER
ncbi:MAG: tetraacyldisaccharide 4'-kinase [Rhodobacteraceae bacterium]|nr:tetraacyldisaccharide 4'-kinase [Paracoccaceae bacterium]